MRDLRWILDELSVAVWVGNVPDGTVAYANKAFERILGMTSVPSSRIDDVPETYGIFDREGRPYPTELLPFSRVLSTGAHTIVDDMVVVRGASETPIRAFASPVLGSHGAMSHVIVAFFDIASEVSAQRQRHLVQERLSFICNHAPIAIWATDTNGTVTLSEGAGLASLGVKPGQLVGQNIFDLYAGHPSIPGYLRRALGGESFWYTAADGDAVYETWLAPMRDEASKMVGLAGLSNDVSQLRKLQNAAMQKDRVNALGTLAASVAHEINNPLTYVLAHCDEVATELATLSALIGEVEGPQAFALRACLDRLEEELAPVRSGTSQIATITRDLQTFSRPDSATLTPVSFRAVIDAVLKLVRKDIEARARLELQLEDTPPVIANEARLIQVVLNLLVNAFQALPPGGASPHVVSIRTYHAGTNVVLDVADSGPGVPKAQRELIFEPFFSTKAIGAGTGLGLFVCRNIVRGLSGEVAVLDAPGGGALFRVTLPAALESAPRAPLPVPPSPSASQRHIVVIDDDALVLKSLRASLMRAGFRVTAVGNGQAGLALLLEVRDVDLVYCDLMMTGMTGMQLATTLGEKVPSLRGKIVFMTGGAFSPEAQSFFVERGKDALVKPFDIVAETHRRLGRGE